MKELINRFPKLEVVKKEIEKVINETINTYERGNKVLIAGNGGSACDSEHIAG